MAASDTEILINGRFLGQRVTGVQRYARETLHALDELLGSGAGAGLRWTVLVPRGTPAPALRHLAVEPLGRLQGHLWEQLELALARAGRPALQLRLHRAVADAAPDHHRARRRRGALAIDLQTASSATATAGWCATSPHAHRAR